MALTAWESLLGLPLDRALEKARAMGLEPTIVTTCAPRHEPAQNSTLRVIRVRGEQGGQSVSLTVSAFADGDPRQA